ncbi:hypothetical protein K501DRAFT_334119 [Backusella circina FSU 941]|nr:hypothetical protein K501DRAFT_334119 [Backusella circina FSU 941]
MWGIGVTLVSINYESNQCNQPCRGCTSMGKPAECTVDSKATAVPSKRGYKTHVPSACVNCKNAHLACDVSRPCRRCVSLNKADTCHDMQHKKRGRPKLKDKKPYSTNEHNYEIIYGTVQTPAITMKAIPTPATPPKQQTPRKIQQQPQFQPQQSTISFIHEPIESFRSQEPSYNNSNSNSNYTSSKNTSLEPPLPVVRLSANPQPFIHELPTTNAINTFNYPPNSPSEPPSVINESTFNSYDSNNTPISLHPPRPTNTSTTTLSTATTTTTTTSTMNTTTPPALATDSSSITTEMTAINSTSPQPAVSTDTINVVSTDDSNITIIMSMEVCCAKVSDQVIKAWGYYPQELSHRSLYDFISPKDSDRLARLHRLLLDNATEFFKKSNVNMTSLPPTERSTSEKFSSTNHSQLKIIANGARSFSDTIHIKQRSGDFELYEVLVHIGGGLGADLYDVSSFPKQYIVAQFKRHQYEVSQKTPYNCNEDEYINHQTPSSSSGFYVFSPMLSPVTPSSLDSPGKLLEHHQQQQLKMQQSQQTEQERMGSLSEIFNFDENIKEQQQHERQQLTPLINHKQMSFMKGSHDPKKENNNSPSSSNGLPKFNIAPLTDGATPKYHTLPIGGRLFKASETSNTLSTRFPPIRLTGGPPSSSTQVTHPTQQYFLQTSSSTLNAAASAAQSLSRRAAPFGPVDSAPVNSAPNRKIEMSIRSLLC